MLEQTLKHTINGLNRWMRHLLLVSVLFCGMAKAQAQSEALKDSADQAYISQDYRKAISLYEKLVDEGYASAELYYNLGNAYFKSDQIAPSILNYERALKLAPHDDDIQFNLKLANMRVKDQVEVIPELFFVTWWNKLLAFFSADGWAWHSVIAFVIALAALLLFRFSAEQGIKRISFYTGVVALLWTGFSIYAAEKQYDQVVNDTRAVIFSPTLTAKSAPNESGKDLFVIHEGLVVQVTDELNGWARIRLSNGDVGWVPVESLQEI